MEKVKSLSKSCENENLQQGNLEQVEDKPDNFEEVNIEPEDLELENLERKKCKLELFELERIEIEKFENREKENLKEEKFGLVEVKYEKQNCGPETNEIEEYEHRVVNLLSVDQEYFDLGKVVQEKFSFNQGKRFDNYSVKLKRKLNRMWKYKFWYVRLKIKRYKVFKIINKGANSCLNGFGMEICQYKGSSKWVKWNIRKRKEKLNRVSGKIII